MLDNEYVIHPRKLSLENNSKIEFMVVQKVIML